MYLDGYVYPNANYGYEVIQRVPNVDAVSACRVPLDGRVSYMEGTGITPVMPVNGGYGDGFGCNGGGM